MSNLRYSKKNEEWVRAHPEVAVAVANLRAQAGMGEDVIVRSMRKELRADVAPSYGDVRAAFSMLKAGHLTVDGQKGKRYGGVMGRGTPLAEWTVEDGKSMYRKRSRAQFSDSQRERLARSTVVAYLIKTYPPVPKDTPHEVRERAAREFGWLHEEAFIEWEESQTYGRTPPL